MPNACFWYDSTARAAFERYAAVLPGAELTLDNGFLFELSLGSSRMSGMNGGPGYSPNKSLSVFLELPTAAAVKSVYDELLGGEGAKVYMALSQTPWSEAYAWIADEWGVNWQLMCVNGVKPALSPALLFTGEVAGEAEAAMREHAALFADAETVLIERYPAGPDEGNVMHAQQRIGTGKMIYVDSSAQHDAAFSPGGSLMVYCETQAEIDQWWRGLARGGGKPGRCGWITDRFGVSWQIVPRGLADWLSNPRHAKRTGEAMQGMTKLILADLQPREGGGTGLERLSVAG